MQARSEEVQGASANLVRQPGLPQPSPDLPQILTHIRCHMDDARIAVETGVDGVYDDPSSAPTQADSCLVTLSSAPRPSSESIPMART